MNTTLPPKLLAFVLSLMLPAVAAAQTSQLADDYNSRGLAKEIKGDHDGAIADYNRAIELDPKQSRPYRNRGFAKLAKGDHDGAVADYNRAFELNPKPAEGAYSSRALAKEAKVSHLPRTATI